MDELLPSCYHYDVIVMNAKSTAEETHVEVTAVKLHLDSGVFIMKSQVAPKEFSY